MEGKILNWRKSSYSGTGGSNCVEAGNDARRVMVRDTKDTQGPMLRFTAGAWRRLVDQVKADASLPADLAPKRGVLRWGCPSLLCSGTDDARCHLAEIHSRATIPDRLPSGTTAKRKSPARP
jgi:hypothetical protein